MLSGTDRGKNINLHLKILAAIYLFLGYGLLLMFVVGQITFFQYWRNPESIVISNTDSFFRQYSEFFELYGINPFQTLMTVICSLAIGHGILRRKIWARYLVFLAAIISLSFYSRDIFDGLFTAGFIWGIILCLYTLWVLISKKYWFD